MHMDALLVFLFILNLSSVSPVLHRRVNGHWSSYFYFFILFISYWFQVFVVIIFLRHWYIYFQGLHITIFFICASLILICLNQCLLFFSSFIFYFLSLLIIFSSSFIFLFTVLALTLRFKSSFPGCTFLAFSVFAISQGLFHSLSLLLSQVVSFVCLPSNSLCSV